MPVESVSNVGIANAAQQTGINNNASNESKIFDKLMLSAFQDEAQDILGNQEPLSDDDDG